jgi:hypothetical protein
MIQIIYFNPVVCNEAIGKRHFRLLEIQKTSFQLNENEVTLEIPIGFEWDGATIPRITWSLIGYYPAGIMLAPSLWHDFIYINKGLVVNMEDGDVLKISRKDCDKLFYEHCIAVGVKRLKALKMYYAIRLFGAYYWRDKK